MVGLVMVSVALALGFVVTTMSSSAQTDITATVTALGAIWTAVSALAITVVLFVIGRRLLRKL